MDKDQFDTVVARLRLQDSDDGSVEAKACGHSLGKSVWATVSAFANTSGGAIVMGLDESSGFAPTDGFEPGRVRDQFVDGMGDANTTGARLTHPPSYELHRHVVGEAPVLVAVIAPNAPGSRPCFVTARGLAGGSYKRVDDKDIALSATEVFSMQNELISLGSDREEVPETTPEALDQQMISSLLAVQSRSRALYGARADAEKLFRLNITTADGTLRRAGLLACATYPQQFLPSHIIDVAVHPSTHKSDPGAPRRFVDRRRCDGTILDMVDDAVYTVARNLRTSSVVTGRGRTDHLEIPEIALREVIANAALHRELSPLFDGTPIVVDVFTDRVQVTSPGGLWGGVTLDNIADGISHCRNPTLLQLLLALPVRHQLGSTLTAAVEGQGSGIPLVHRLMAEEGLAPPHFEAKPDAFVVTLYRQDHEPGDIPDNATRVEPRVTSDDAVLAALSDTVERSIAEIATSSGRTPGALRHVLRRLIASGRVKPTAPPSSKKRRYLLTKTPGPQHT